MRTLSESLNGQNCAINNKRKIDEKQQEEIDSLKADVASINGDIESINTELENETVNKTTGNFSNAVSSPTMTTNDLTATNATIVNGEIAHIDATDIDADVADIGRLEATSSVTTNATVTNATINTADISTANITDANVTNWSIENFTAEDATVDDLVVNNSVSADVANIPTVNATDIDTVTLDATTVNGTTVNATDLTATYGNVSTLENQILKNEFITHEDYYIDINQVLSDTDFVVIELPKIQTGDYRVTYKQLVDGYPALTQFSLTLNETDDNQWFSYSRAPNQKYMDEIAIKDGKLYIKTWFTGRLYFHSDTLANVTSPKIYSDWPIDTTDLDYPLFSASRAKATVYTHYVNLGMDADSYGSAVLTINPTSDYEDCAEQAETAPEIQYDPNTDTQIYLYVPNQDVNKEADVEFENAKINDTLTIPENAAIDIEDMADNQYITKRDGATAYRDISDGQIDDQPLSRLEDDLVTERKITNWNGATNRQYSPGGEQTITDTENFVGPTGQNCSIDPDTGAVTPGTQDYYAYGRKVANMTYERIQAGRPSDPYQSSETYYNPQHSTPAANPESYPDGNFSSSTKPAGSESYTTSYGEWRGYNDIPVYVWTKGIGAYCSVRETTNTSDPLLPYNARVVHDWCDYGLFERGTTSKFFGDLDALVPGASENNGIEYVYKRTNGSRVKYAVSSVRDDAHYLSLSWNSGEWTTWDTSQGEWPYYVNGSDARTFVIQLNDALGVYGVKKNDNSDFLFYGTLRWLIRDVTTTYAYPDTATDWKVYWTGNTGTDDYTKFTVNGSTSGIKYWIGDTIPNPLVGYDYYEPVDITDEQNKNFVIFINKPASINFNTHTYTLEKVITNEVIYSSSITHVGKITEGEWNAGQIVAPKVTTDELTADEITIDNDLTVTGNASIGGNLNVTGTIITVHSEEITTEENTIKLRDGAQTAIQPGEMSGIVIENYDGQGNDSEIALDSNGTLRIGDTNDTEPVATRDEANNFTNGNYVAWDAANSRLVDSGTAPTDLREWASIVGFDEYEDKTGDTSYTDIDDILTTLTTYTVSKGITSVLFEAPITSQTEFDMLNLTPTWLASGYLTGTLKILGGNVTFISKDNNIGWRYDGSTWSSLDVKTHAQIKLNYTGDWSTQTAAQKMDDGYAYNPNTEAAYVTGDSTGKYAVIAPTEMIVKNATGYNDSYTFKGGYKFNDALILPTGLSSIYGGNIPNGAIWIN